MRVCHEPRIMINETCSPEVQKTKYKASQEGCQLWGGTHHSKDGERDDQGEGDVSSVGTGVDVWVAGLIELQHAEAGDYVHEGGV